MKKLSIEFTKVNRDTNGNPRYVCHFLNLLTEKDKELNDVNALYHIALNNARKIGGRKFHNKQYGGGIVFQSYNIKDTEKAILDIQLGIEKWDAKTFMFVSDAKKFQKEKRKEGYKTKLESHLGITFPSHIVKFIKK
jgi:hypothetical protein